MLVNNKDGKFYSPVVTVLIVIGIYITSQIVAGILISILPMIKNMNAEQANAWLQSSVWSTFAFVLLVEGATIAFLYYFMNNRQINFPQIGFNKPRSRYTLYALLGFAAYFVIYIIGLVIAKAIFPGLDLEQKQDLGFDTSIRGWQLLPALISLVVLPPLTEEIVARGFMLGGLRSKFNFLLAAVITSLLFALAHIGGASDGLLWVAVIDTFILSMVLCYLREKTGSLWPSIYVHMAKNSLAFLILFNIAGYIK